MHTTRDSEKLIARVRRISTKRARTADELVDIVRAYVR